MLYGLLILSYVIVKGFFPRARMLGQLIVKSIVYWRLKVDDCPLLRASLYNNFMQAVVMY